MAKRAWILALLVGAIGYLAAAACILPGEQPYLTEGDDDDDVLGDDDDDDAADDDAADDDVADDDVADDDVADDDDDTQPQDDTIFDVQQGLIPEGSQVELLDVVVTTPIAAQARGFFAQEPVYASQAQYSGIWIYLADPAMVDELSGVVGPDALVNIRGTYMEYNDLSEIEVTSSSNITAAGQHELLPADIPPCDIATGGTYQEAYEGVLVRVANVEVTSENPDAPDNDWGEWEVANCLRVDDMFHHVEPTEGATYTHIIGVMNYSHDNAKLEPRVSADLAGGN